jgi:signal transduction histidine kinase/ActR/RegA family two-component response regulator
LTREDPPPQVESERIELLWEAASILLTVEEPDAMLRAVFDRIAPHLGLDVYFNYLADARGEHLVLASYAGVGPEQASELSHLELGQAICGHVALDRRPIAVECIQVSNDASLAWVRRLGVRAYACNPLVSQGALFGTLSFGSRRKERFEAAELEFLSLICHYVTAAYQRLHLIRRLRESDRRKDEFLATLAHELRNPLAPISNAMRIARLSTADAAMRERALRIMERQVHNLVRLVDDLLDVSRITRSKLELQRERLNLASILSDAIETVRSLLEQNRHRLAVQQPEQPIELYADPVRLTQVFANLLDNAAKFMSPGGEIDVSVEPDEQQVTVRVRDRGIGISAELMGAIFEPFGKGDCTHAHARGGLGIGLTLARRLVEMHDGSISAHSAGPGLGAEFLVTLPREVADVRRAGPQDAPSNANGEQHSRILVADDNVDSAESLGLMLRLMGNEVRVTYDGTQALQEADAFHPDVIVLDIGMPRLDGYATARRIRQQPWGKAVLLAALTGWGQAEDKRRAAEAGFDCHFTKPVTPASLNELTSRIQQRGA